MSELCGKLYQEGQVSGEQNELLVRGGRGTLLSCHIWSLTLTQENRSLPGLDTAQSLKKGLTSEMPASVELQPQAVLHPGGRLSCVKRASQEWPEGERRFPGSGPTKGFGQERGLITPHT